MKETIAEMLKIEAQAKEIVAAGQEEAARIVRQARQEAAAIQDAAERDAQTKTATILDERSESARERRKDVLATINDTAEQLRQVPQERADAAKALILTALAGR